MEGEKLGVKHVWWNKSALKVHEVTFFKTFKRISWSSSAVLPCLLYRKHSLPFLFVGRSKNSNVLKDGRYLSLERKNDVCVCEPCRNLCWILLTSTATTVCAHTVRPATWPPACRAASPTSPLSTTTPWLCSATVPPAPHRTRSVRPSEGWDSAVSCHQLFYWHELLWIKRWNHDIRVSVRFFLLEMKRFIFNLKKRHWKGITHLPVDKGLCVYAYRCLCHLVNTYLKINHIHQMELGLAVFII